MNAVAHLIRPETPVDVRRTLDASRINDLANHPQVRPFIGHPDAGPLDFTNALADPRNIALVFEHGAFLFAHLDPGRYEMHTFTLPQGRGAGVLAAAESAFRYMFVETDCAELLTKVPASNKPADLMARRAGFLPVFTRASAWEDGSDLVFFTLTFEGWSARDPMARAEGRAFHAALGAAKAATESPDPTHPDDDAHDGAAGAACLMAKAGNPAKAVWAYSRWARFAGYQPIALVSSAPVLIDAGDALITFRSGSLEILKCPVR